MAGLTITVRAVLNSPTLRTFGPGQGGVGSTRSGGTRRHAIYPAFFPLALAACSSGSDERQQAATFREASEAREPAVVKSARQKCWQRNWKRVGACRPLHASSASGALCSC